MTAFLELQQEAPVPRRRRGFALAAAAVVTAVAATAVALTVFQPAARPAYALNPNSDGTVTFTINDAGDPAGASEALRAAGIHAVVMTGHKRGECPADQRGTRDSRPWSTLLTAVQSNEYRRTHPDALRSVVIQPDRIPPGAVLVIGTMEASLDGERIVFVHPELFTDPGPACYETDVNVDKLLLIQRDIQRQMHSK